MIRRLTHSQFSHVDFVLTQEMANLVHIEPGLLGASGPDKTINDPGGVRVRPFNAWPYLGPPKVARIQCSIDVAKLALAAALTQRGKPFDKSAMWGFLSDQHRRKTVRDWRADSAWFCSELIIWACERGGLFHPHILCITKNRITPNDTLLIFNQYMSADNIREFLP
jgi:hypothetical protein